MKRPLLFLPILALAAPAFADPFTVHEPLFREPPNFVRTHPLAPPHGEALVRNPSPDGRFMAEIWGADGESPGRWAVLRYPDGNRLVLGDSDRGIAVRWWPTQIGPLLSLHNDQDTHYNEAFVIRPVGGTPDSGYEVLYSTAHLALPLLEHSYTEIRNISPGGILSLGHGWDYAPARGNPGSGEWTIPIFLGRDEPETDASLVRRWCESAEFPFHPELASKQRIETIPEDIARAIERLKESDPGALAAAFAVLLLRDYALQRAVYPSGFTLEPLLPSAIVGWEANRLGFPDGFPPSAQAQLVCSDMASAIVRHTDELFAADPDGRRFAEWTKALLATPNDEVPATPGAAEEKHAESAETAE